MMIVISIDIYDVLLIKQCLYHHIKQYLFTSKQKNILRQRYKLSNQSSLRSEMRGVGWEKGKYLKHHLLSRTKQDKKSVDWWIMFMTKLK